MSAGLPAGKPRRLTEKNAADKERKWNGHGKKTRQTRGEDEADVMKKSGSAEKISIFSLKIYISSLKIHISKLKICISNLEIDFP